MKKPQIFYLLGLISLEWLRTRMHQRKPRTAKYLGLYWHTGVSEVQVKCQLTLKLDAQGVADQIVPHIS